MEELIRRSDAIREINAQYASNNITHEVGLDMARAIENIPAVEPWDLYNPDEWCRDCKEYDTEHHNCPRWNRVIRRTLEENQPKQGEWERSGLGSLALFRCSACGVREEEKTTFCPNCGAKMKGAGDEID